MLFYGSIYLVICVLSELVYAHYVAAGAWPTLVKSVVLMNSASEVITGECFISL